MSTVTVSSAALAHHRQILLIAKLEAVAARAWYKTLRVLADKTAAAYADNGQAGVTSVMADFAKVVGKELEANWRLAMTPNAVNTYATLKPTTKARKPTGKTPPPVPVQTYVDKAIAAWNAKYAGEKIKSITTTQLDVIRRSLTEANAEGWSIPQTSAHVHKSIADRSKSDAMRIARTETHAASMAGVDAGARATGLEFRKQWVAAVDTRTRGTHTDADGQEVGGDELFNVGGEALKYPGDPIGFPENVINCRCTYLTVPV